MEAVTIVKHVQMEELYFLCSYAINILCMSWAKADDRTFNFICV